MNYYPHHIGDFNSATRHLTRVERSLYRDLIELYYDTEQPLPADDFDRLARRVIAVSEEEKAALGYVLEEFFELDGDAYRHSRCDEEIEKYQANSSAKAKAGKASAEARRRKAESARSKNPAGIEQGSTGVEQVLNMRATNQEPRTKNQEDRPASPKLGSSPVKLKTFLAKCKTDSVKPVPENDPVFEWADDAGIPPDFLWLAWREFVARYLEEPKKYKDWRAVFRKAVRGNWLKLWYADNATGEYRLTTAGVQAERVHKEAA